MFERYDPRNWEIAWEALLQVTIGLSVAILAALAIHWVLFTILRRIVRLSVSQIDDMVVDAVRSPMRWAMIAIAVSIGAHTDALVGSGWDIVVSFVSPALLGWVAYAIVKGLAAGWDAHLQTLGDPVALRSQRTRIAILARTVKVAIVIIAVSLVMLNIPSVRDIGVTMMASAASPRWR